jgi:hypothetical protein
VKSTTGQIVGGDMSGYPRPAERRLTDLCLQQQIAAVGERFARQRAIDFRLALRAGRQFFGLAARQMRLFGPVDRGDIDVVAELHLIFSVMHEHGEEKNDRQRNSDQPEQNTLPE